MLNLILALMLSPFHHHTAVAQVQTCAWPHVCTQQADSVAQVQTCVWPHVCKEQPQAFLSEAPAGGTVQTCQLPNKCG